MKTMPFGEIWEEYCRVCGKPADGEWFPVIENTKKKYSLREVNEYEYSGC
jgi:L-rhamnose isomerase